MGDERLKLELKNLDAALYEQAYHEVQVLLLKAELNYGTDSWKKMMPFVRNLLAAGFMKDDKTALAFQVACELAALAVNNFSEKGITRKIYGTQTGTTHQS